jgi:aldehyde dehydrogenase (NAD+)
MTRTDNVETTPAKGARSTPEHLSRKPCSMNSSQREVFGPVLVVLPNTDDAEALKIANDSDYGLSGSVFSSSLDRGLDFARRVRSGTINVNGGLFYGADAPYGGYKASGVGRQNGIEGFEQHLETQVVGYR